MLTKLVMRLGGCVAINAVDKGKGKPSNNFHWKDDELFGNA
jgi:hypothetical protein